MGVELIHPKATVREVLWIVSSILKAVAIALKKRGAPHCIHAITNPLWTVSRREGEAPQETALEALAAMALM